jgi:hypothetical protein
MLVEPINVFLKALELSQEKPKPKQFIVMSPCYEILRYGHNKIKDQVVDAHTGGKLAKFIIGPQDLTDPSKSPIRNNFKFEACQFDAADVVLFVNNGKTTVLKGEE